MGGVLRQVSSGNGKCAGLLNRLSGRSKKHGFMEHGSDRGDLQPPGHFNTAVWGAYRRNQEKSLFGVWDHSIPMVTGRQHWDASWMGVPILVRASERDFWVRAEDREALQERWGGCGWKVVEFLTPE